MTDDPWAAGFRSQLIVRELDTGEKLLMQDLAFYSAELRGILIAPAGSVTDYASIPRGFWNLLPKDGPWKRAAVMHDGAYKAGLVTEQGERIHLIKPLADRLFLECMASCGVTRWKRNLMFRLVSRFGGRVYGGLGQPVA